MYTGAVRHLRRHVLWILNTNNKETPLKHRGKGKVKNYFKNCPTIIITSPVSPIFRWPRCFYFFVRVVVVVVDASFTVGWDNSSFSWSGDLHFVSWCAHYWSLRLLCFAPRCRYGIWLTRIDWEIDGRSDDKYVQVGWRLVVCHGLICVILLISSMLMFAHILSDCRRSSLPSLAVPLQVLRPWMPAAETTKWRSAEETVTMHGSSLV